MQYIDRSEGVAPTKLSRKITSQAEAHVEVMNTAVSDTVATKADLNLLEAKLGADLKSALSALETRLIKWVVGALLAAAAVNVAAIGILIAVLN